MHWIHLTDEDQLQKIIVKSQEKPQVIFKYSNRCYSSQLILDALQKDCCPEQVDFYFLDLITYRNISDKIVETFHVEHHSPQILVVKDGDCIFDASHSEISLENILEQAHVTV